MARRSRPDPAAPALTGSFDEPPQHPAGPAGDGPDNSKSTGRGQAKREDRPDQVEVWIGDLLVHRVPPAIARSLRYLLAGEALPTRMSVTSALHGEGVTSVSRSLATLMAHDWSESTCWVDLNWWNNGTPAHEAALFDLTLLDVVQGRGVVAGLPRPTSIPGLSMVTAGEAPMSARARLARSDALASVIHELAETFDYVVVDLPPVLASSDAVTLSELTEGYLLVVRQGSTSSVQVEATLRAVSSVPCLGTVLNGARTNVPRWLRTSNEIWALGN